MPANAAPTPPPAAAPTLLRRAPATPYSFVCGDQTLTWEASWYTEEFYTASSSFYDDRASYGPINPPWSVWGTLTSCAPGPATATFTPSSTNSESLTTDTTTESSTSSSTTSDTPSPAAVTSSVRSTAARSSRTSTAVPSSTTSSTTASSATPTTKVSVLSSVSALTSMPNHSSWTSTLASTSAATGFINPIAGSLASLNSRAGSWDAQAQGITLVAAVAVALGAAAWGLWMVLRKPLSAFYSPRSWFISSSAQPPAPSLAAAAAPFLHLPPLAGPTGEANVATHVQSSVLGVSAVGAVISLGAFLPLIIAGVPHLSESSPSNSLGGRLGSLTDLSILRLLNAIPPPGTQTSLVRRATASVASLGSAHTRLIILVILSGVVWVGAGLFILRRIHNKLLRYTEDFEDACAGQEMVFVPNQPSWDGKSEAAIKSSLSGLCNTGREYITGVFSVGHLHILRARIRERNALLETLEITEAQNIAASKAVPGSTNRESSNANIQINIPDNVRGLTSPSVDSGIDVNNNTGFSHESHTPTEENGDYDFGPATGTGSSMFFEVQQRASVVRHQGKLMIGQRVVRDDDGTFLRAPEDESAARDEKKEEPEDKAESSAMAVAEKPAASPEVASLTREDSPTSTFSVVEKPHSLDASIVAQLTTDDYADLRWSRARLFKINKQIDSAQKQALPQLTNGTATGDNVRAGFIIVGRGVRSLPNAVDIPGRSKEDILWDNLGAPSGVGLFWAKVVAVGVLAAAMSLIFLGLAVASAPGVSDRLSFFESLSIRNDMGSGVVEGLVASLGITLALVGGVLLIERFAKQARLISFTAQQALSLKASFYFLFIVGTILFTLIGALLFAIPAFHAGSQKAQSVGDGAAYITFLALVLVVNICILVPGLLILRPVSLVRWYLATRKAVTPRQRFRANCPPSFSPTIALTPVLAGFFALSAFAGLLPLMVVPVIILAYLSLIAATWLATHVFCISRGGPSNGKLGLWLVRRLGWAVCLQPAILGLVSLSRRQWIAGGLGLGFALLGLIISETLTFSYGREDPGSEYLERPEVPDDADAEEQDRRATTSTNSRLLTAYMPLPTRLPSSNPLPLVTDAIDDLVATERAANATPGTAALDVFGADTAPDLWDESRGVIYPPELIASEPLVWLPRDTKGFAKRAVASLGEDGLQGFVDPGPMSGTGTGTGASADVSKSEKHKSTSTTTATA